jgi:hypothetical protein
VTFAVFGSAALLVAGAVLVGDATRTLGLRCRAAAPAVGLALLIVLADIAIQLPGRAVTATVAVLGVIAAAAILVVLRRQRDGWGTVRSLAIPAAAGILAAVGAAIPFLANGTVGLPGVSFDNDTSMHLLWAEMLRSPAVAARYGGLPNSYPLGPHSLVDALSTGVGLRLDLAFTALLVATLVITAVVGSAALREESGWKRVVTGVLAALFYLVAAYYAEGAFKEPLVGLFLLGFVLQVEEVRGGWAAAPTAGRAAALLPLAVLSAGAIYVYSYTALAWLGLTVVIWLGAEAIWSAISVRGRRRSRRLDARAVIPPVAAAAGALLLLLAASAGRILNFVGSIGLSAAGTGAIPASNLGNLPAPLSPYEALGIWNSPEFRVLPANVFQAGELSAFALGVLVFGLVVAISRRDLVLPAAVAACTLVYWYSNGSQSPYVTAKALVVAGPVVAVTGMRGLLGATRAGQPGWTRPVRVVLGAAFVALALHSSFLALRTEPVWPSESTSELTSMAKLTRGQTVLFLGNSDYGAWMFSGSDMSALASNMTSMGQASAPPNKPFVYGLPTDFDSVDPSTINRFRWVVTSNTSYASQTPPGFVLVRRLPLYDLWERVGVVQRRRVLEASGAPGAVLDCHDRLAKALSRRRGVAAVMATPVAAPLVPVAAGTGQTVSLKLPAGRWDLSLQYTSPMPVQVSAGGRQWRMPAYTDRPGPYFAVGSVVSEGMPVPVTIRALKPSWLTGNTIGAAASALAAVRSPWTRTVVPLSAACGRYVDWYELQ